MKHLLVLIIPLIVYSCKSTNNLQGQKIAQDSIIKKWQNAVVDIECKQEKYSPLEIEKIMNQVIKEDSNIKHLRFLDIRDSLKKVITTLSGTAIYLADNGNKYLITAKHVVYDNNWTQRHINSTQDKSPHTKSYFEKLNPYITIRTNFDIFLSGKINSFEAENNFTDSSTRPYQFSNDDIDIAIISLQSKDLKILAKNLDATGFMPINVSDIDSNNNLKLGQDIFAIGYPAASSIIKNKGIEIVLPMITFGKIALNHEKIPLFFGDITVYPGNSGGPVISDNKLIGIVSKQVTIPLSTEYSEYKLAASAIESRGTLAIVKKSSEIIRLLRTLQEKERNVNFQ